VRPLDDSADLLLALARPVRFDPVHV